LEKKLNDDEVKSDLLEEQKARDEMNELLARYRKEVEFLNRW